MRRAVYPGSFDPVTNGHLDIIERVVGMVDRLTIAIGTNPGKSGLFGIEERVRLLREVTSTWPTVTVATFDGLLVDFCAQQGIDAIVKGLRAVGDFDYELQMAQMNRRLTGIETVFVMTAPEYSFLSSSLVKEVASYGGDVSGLVPAAVAARLAGLAEQDQEG